MAARLPVAVLVVLTYAVALGAQNDWAEGPGDSNGATRDYYNRGALLQRRNYLGDRHVRDGTAQGDAAWATTLVEDTDTGRFIEWDVTYLVQAWIDGELQRINFVNLAGEFYLPFSGTPTAVEVAAYLEPQFYDHQFGGDWLDYAVQLAGFRGDDGLTRQEIYLTAPAAAILDSANADLQFEIVAFDERWAELARHQETLPAAAATRAGRNARALVHQLELRL